MSPARKLNLASPISVLYNDEAWCCIIECHCSLKRRPHIRRRFGRRIIRRLPKVPVQTAAPGVVRKLPVPPCIRRLPVPPSRAADTGVKPLPTPPVRRLPTPPPLKPRAVTQPGRPLPLVSFPTTPSVACSTPMLMQASRSPGGHADEMLLSPLIDWDVVMDEIIYRNSNASSTAPDTRKGRRDEVVFHGEHGSWRASFTRTL